MPSERLFYNIEVVIEYKSEKDRDGCLEMAKGLLERANDLGFSGTAKVDKVELTH